MTAPEQPLEVSFWKLIRHRWKHTGAGHGNVVLVHVVRHLALNEGGLVVLIDLGLKMEGPGSILYSQKGAATGHLIRF